MPIRGFARQAANNQQRKLTSDTTSGFGGLVEEEHPLGRKPTDLIEARNVARKGFMLGTRPTIELDDATEPDLGSLIAYWPMDDAEGGLIREKIGKKAKIKELLGGRKPPVRSQAAQA